MDLCQNSSKTTKGCASALTSPIHWCSVNCLHKRVRLKWTTAHGMCVLDDIGKKLFSPKKKVNGHDISSINIYGTSLGNRSGSGMTSITSWTLNVHCIRNVIKLLLSWLRAPFRAWRDVVCVIVGFNGGHTRYWVTMWLLRRDPCAIWRGVLRYGKVIFEWKLAIMIAKASNIDGLNILSHFIFLPIRILKIK